MARRVFFHIGAPKSGTTFLQTVMWRNRPVLREQGVLYPGKSRMEHFYATQAVRGLQTVRRGRAVASWNHLRDSVADWHDTGLITHEFFSAASAEHAARAIEELRPAEVHVVFTARDYVRQFSAAWQQGLKMRTDDALDEYIEKALKNELTGPWSWSTQDIAAILDRWGKTLDPAHVHLVTVPPKGAPRRLLWDRWCQVLGIDPDSCDLDVAIGNESLGVRQAALLHRVKPYVSGPLLEGSNRYNWVRGYLAHQVLVPQGGDRFGLRADHVQQLRALSQEAANQIADRGYDVVGDLDDLVPPEPTDLAANPGDVTDGEMVEVAAAAIEQMVRDVRELTQERDRWRRRARAAESRAGKAVAQPGLRAALAHASEQRPWLMRARRVYWVAMRAYRRVRG